MTTPLEDIQDGVLERLHRGEDVDRDALLAEHPTHAEALRAFFGVLDLVEAGPDSMAMPARLGDFRIVGELGRGGMGVVYEAQQESLKRRVALKVLPAAMRTDPRLIARFRREAEAAGRLRHPGIVPVYSVGEEGGAPFFAMELIEGRSLERVIRDMRAGDADGVPADGDERRRWAAETIASVADALAYAHAQGVLHRDVKPGNVILEADGTTRLTDFGLALDLQAPGLTVAGEVFGSPHYMSPEQAVRREQPLDARTDVYSLGVTLYELLTLRLPYDATTAQQLLTALVTGKLVPPRKVDANIPKPLAAVVMKALAKQPAERYGSAQAFAADLRAAVEGERVEALRPVPKAPSTWRRIARVAGAVAAVAVIGLAALAAYDEWLRPRVPRDYEVQDRLFHSDALTLDLIDRLAKGEDPEGEERMRNAFDFEVRLREVLARSQFHDYTTEITWGELRYGRGDYPIVIEWEWEVATNGGEWRSLDTGTHVIETLVHGGGETTPRKRTLASQHELARMLGDSLDAAMNSPPTAAIDVQHRCRLRIVKIPEDHLVGPGILLPKTGGTQITWTGESRTVYVKRRNAKGYPARITSEDVDPLMSEALTPRGMYFEELEHDDAGNAWWGVTVLFGRTHVPVNVAADVELYFPGLDEPFGKAELLWRESEVRPRYMGEDAFSLRFEVPKSRSKELEAQLHELWKGHVTKVRVVTRPSLGAALRAPDFDRYWGGTVDAIAYPISSPRRPGLTNPFEADPSTGIRPERETSPAAVIRDYREGTTPLEEFDAVVKIITENTPEFATHRADAADALVERFRNEQLDQPSVRKTRARAALAMSELMRGPSSDEAGLAIVEELLRTWYRVKSEEIGFDPRAKWRERARAYLRMKQYLEDVLAQ